MSTDGEGMAKLHATPAPDENATIGNGTGIGGAPPPYTGTGPPQGKRYELPPEHQAILDRKLASNGLAYRPYTCVRCGYHLTDQAILLGTLRKKCPNCKFPNELEINRVGEEELMEHMARKHAEG